MIVTHLAKFFHPDHGGMETMLLDLVEHCAGAGVLSRIVAYAKPRRRYPRDRRVRRCPSAIIGGSAPVSFAYWASGAGIRDGIVHIHAPNPIACSAARLIPPHVPIVVTHHADSLGRPVIARATERERSYAYCRAACLIATSHAYADGSPELDEVRRKVVVVPLGIEDPVAGCPPQRRPTSRPARVVAIGRLVPYKAFDVLIRAVALLSPSAVSLAIAGEGPELERLRALAAGMPHVALLGRIDDAAKDRLLREATIFCLPSRSRAEAFGLSIVEALAYGLPVVTTEIGSGNTSINLDGITGRNVPPDDPAALAAAIADLSVAHGVEAMSASARARFLRHYTRRRMGDAYLQIYRWIERRRLAAQVPSER